MSQQLVYKRGFLLEQQRFIFADLTKTAGQQCFTQQG
jgi:hypothetical protein